MFPSGDYEADCLLMGKEFTDAVMASGIKYLLTGNANRLVLETPAPLSDFVQRKLVLLR